MSLSEDAKLVEVRGSYDNCVRKAEEFALENNYLLCGDYEIRRKGQRSVGHELAKLKSKIDTFVVPVGNGTLGCALSEGLSEYGQFPSLIGVQGSGADPIYKAWANNGNAIAEIKAPTTIESAIKVGKPLDGKLTLDWVRKTKGCIISVSDNEINQSQELLAKKEGIFVEKAAAATLAGLMKIDTQRYKAKNVVLILTGNGLKENSDS